MAADSPHCRNCGRELGGDYCADCGQKHTPRVLTLRELFRDVLGEFVTWDSKLLRSLRPLLFRPGFLTREYLSGRRTRYLLPTRLYIIISLVVFFLLLGAGPMLTTALGTERIAQLAREHAMSPVEIGGELNQKFRAVLPWIMVLSIPVFALALGLLYRRPRRFYIEHLLFSIHFFAFSLLFLIPLFLSLIAGPPGVLALLGLFVCYLLLAIRRVYQQGWGMTILKTFVLCVVFLNLLYVTIYASLQIALLLL